MEHPNYRFETRQIHAGLQPDEATGSRGPAIWPTAAYRFRSCDRAARLHDYRYEYKKRNYLRKPDYTTDITLKIYARYRTTDIRRILRFEKICEQYTGEESNYVIGEIALSELLAKRPQLTGDDVFLANIPVFFLSRDN